MILKLIGAILIVGSCTVFGLAIRLSHRKTVKMVQELISAIQYMECELEYRAVTLPELCKNAGKLCSDSLKCFFIQLEKELEMQVLPEPYSCVQAAAGKIRDIPDKIHFLLDKLGTTLGQFGIDGQLSSFHETVLCCKSTLSQLTEGENERFRSYQTLAVCSGAALVILFL